MYSRSVCILYTDFFFSNNKININNKKKEKREGVVAHPPIHYNSFKF